jgi:hypothetical protein
MIFIMKFYEKLRFKWINLEKFQRDSVIFKISILFTLVLLDYKIYYFNFLLIKIKIYLKIKLREVNF